MSGTSTRERHGRENVPLFLRITSQIATHFGAKKPVLDPPPDGAPQTTAVPRGGWSEKN
jgi:hypothetical protein